MDIIGGELELEGQFLNFSMFMMEGNGQSDVFTFFAVSRSIFKMAVSSIFGWNRRTLISRGTIL